MHGCHVRPGGAIAGRAYRFAALLGLFLGAVVPGAAFSQTSGHSLTDPRLVAQYNALESAAAFANQATYDTLQLKCFQTSTPDPSCGSPQVLAQEGPSLS